MEYLGITLISHFVELLLLSLAKTTSGYQINQRGKKSNKTLNPDALKNSSQEDCEILPLYFRIAEVIKTARVRISC